METYRLAVCEDEDRVRKDLCSLCGEILAEEGIAYEITEFASAACQQNCQGCPSMRSIILRATTTML